MLHRRQGHLAESELLGRETTERDEFEAQAEAPLPVTPDEMVLLERHHQSVRRRPGQARGRLQFGEIERPRPERLQDHRRLVDHADAAYTGHIQERYPRI